MGLPPSATVNVLVVGRLSEQAAQATARKLVPFVSLCYYSCNMRKNSIVYDPSVLC
jgi:hypothetical protein